MLAALSAAIALGWKPMTLVFVRHAETQANATGKYNSRTIDTFSALGVRQVAALTSKLQGMRFDAIVVSPSPRALRTIAPYLRLTHQRAAIWPELYECCDANTKKIKGPTSTILRRGGPVQIPPDLQNWFVVVPGDERMFVAPSYEDGLRQVQRAADWLRFTYGGRGKTVLVVGHSLHGGRMLEVLQGRKPEGRLRPNNAAIMIYREEPNGTFSPVRSSASPQPSISLPAPCPSARFG